MANRVKDLGGRDPAPRILSPSNEPVKFAGMQRRREDYAKYGPQPTPPFLAIIVNTVVDGAPFTRETLQAMHITNLSEEESGTEVRDAPGASVPATWCRVNFEDLDYLRFLFDGRKVLARLGRNYFLGGFAPERRKSVSRFPVVFEHPSRCNAVNMTEQGLMDVLGLTEPPEYSQALHLYIIDKEPRPDAPMLKIYDATMEQVTTLRAKYRMEFTYGWVNGVKAKLLAPWPHRESDNPGYNWLLP